MCGPTTLTTATHIWNYYNNNAFLFFRYNLLCIIYNNNYTNTRQGLWISSWLTEVRWRSTAWPRKTEIIATRKGDTNFKTTIFTLIKFNIDTDTGYLTTLSFKSSERDISHFELSDHGVQSLQCGMGWIVTINNYNQVRQHRPIPIISIVPVLVIIIPHIQIITVSLITFPYNKSMTITLISGLNLWIYQYNLIIWE